MGHRSVKGKIEYLTDGKGLRGQEEFTITTHGDGSRRLRASCEMYDEDLLRDVFLSVDSNWRPLNAHVHLMISGSFLGTSHYVFSEDMVRVQSHTARDGYQVQKIALSRPPPCFGSHSVQNDAWTYGAFDEIRMGEHPGQLIGIPVTSKLPNGGDGPGIVLSNQQHCFMGEEEISTRAGTFVTRHYEFLFDQWPSIHYWIHGEDNVLVKCRWDFLEQTYELVSLDEPTKSL